MLLKCLDDSGKLKASLTKIKKTMAFQVSGDGGDNIREYLIKAR